MNYSCDPAISHWRLCSKTFLVLFSTLLLENDHFLAITHRLHDGLHVRVLENGSTQQGVGLAPVQEYREVNLHLRIGTMRFKSCSGFRSSTSTESFMTLYWKLSTRIMQNSSVGKAGNCTPTAALCTTILSGSGCGTFSLALMMAILSLRNLFFSSGFCHWRRRLRYILFCSLRTLNVPISSLSCFSKNSEKESE